VVQDQLDGDGVALDERVEVDRVDLQRPGRGDLQAAEALVAVVEVDVQLVGLILVVDQPLVRAARDDLGDGAGRVGPQLFGEEVLIEVAGVVDVAAGPAHHRTEGQVLEQRPESAARVALDVGEVDQEIGLQQRRAEVPILDVLERAVDDLKFFSFGPPTG